MPTTTSASGCSAPPRPRENSTAPITLRAAHSFSRRSDTPTTYASCARVSSVSHNTTAFTVAICPP